MKRMTILEQTDYERVKAELILIESKLKLLCKSH
jgi:hypothetical protein